MKSWLLLCFVAGIAFIAPSANAFMLANGKAESGYSVSSQRTPNKPPANIQCKFPQNLLPGWLAAWREPDLAYSTNRIKNRADCTSDAWLKSANSWLIVGRELLLRSARAVSLSFH